MKNIVLLSVMYIFSLFTVSASHVTVINSGFTFSPDTVMIHIGDTINFSLASMHDAVEVTIEIWEANGTTKKPGGFAVPFGGGPAYAFATTGTYYYVCEAHASSGMKGVIIVNAATGNAEKTISSEVLTISPNPVRDNFKVTHSLYAPSYVSLDIIDMSGVKVFSTPSIHQNAGAQEEIYELPAAVPDGNYLLELSTDDRKTVLKIVVEH